MTMTVPPLFLPRSCLYPWIVLLLILVITNFLSSSGSQLLTSGDEMVLSIDLSSVAHLPMRQELVIRVYNVLTNLVICQRYMVEQEEDGMFTCSLREPLVEFRNGPNYFAMEMVSVQTGKHYLRQTLPTIYHLDNTLYDGYEGSVNATSPLVLFNTMLVSGVSAALKWGMDHLFNHIADKEHFPSATISPRPWQTIARKQIYRNPHHGSTLTHMQQTEQQQPQQQQHNDVKSLVHSLPSKPFQSPPPSPPRIPKKKMETLPHPSVRIVAQRRRLWKLPRLTNEQSKTIGHALKFGFMLSLVYPAMKGSARLFPSIVPQNMSIIHIIPSWNQTQTALMTCMGSIASKLLHREMKKKKNEEKMYSYTTIDGYDIPLSSPVFGEEDTKKVVSIVSPSTFPTSSSGKRNAVVMPNKEINYYGNLKRWFQRTLKRLITTPPPGKPRCPLRIFFGQ